ncbi:MAG TPA: flavin reductase family protein, partial [Bacteroidia bacterium]|nr:flavin reductase family protein [Bacteroidia bacterium]
GTGGGAGNIIICDIIHIHISEDILNADGRIDQIKIDTVGRMGANFYCRAHGNALFEQPQPGHNLGIGIDSLPASIRNSKILSGNDLGRLGNIPHLPTAADVAAYKSTNIWKFENEEDLHREAKRLLEGNHVVEAWKVLLAGS